MLRRAGITLVLLMLALLAMWASLRTASHPPDASRPPDAAQRAAATASADSGSGPPPAPDAPSRRPVEDLVTIRGVIENAYSKAPIAGARVIVRPYPLLHASRLPKGVSWAIAGEDLTKAGGGFVLEVARNVAWLLKLSVAWNGAEYWMYLDPIKTAKELDLGVLELPPGSFLNGQVVEIDGAALDGLRLTLGTHPSGTISDLTPIPVVNCDIAPGNTFRTARALTPGTWHFFADGGYDIIGAPTVRVTATGIDLPDPVRVVVRRQVEFSGRVLDVQGHPLQGIQVNLDGGMMVFTDENGYFRAWRSAESMVEYVELQDPKSHYSSKSVRGPWPATTSGLEFVMSAGHALKVTVEDGKTGTRILRFEARAFSRTPFALSAVDDMVVRNPGTASAKATGGDGVARLPSLPDAPLWLMVIPDDEANYSASILTPVEPSVREVKVTLDQIAAPVRVVDAAGNPVPKARVRLLGRAPTKGGHGASIEATPQTLRWQQLLLPQVWIVYSDCRTDSNGNAIPRAPRQLEKELRVNAPGYGELTIPAWRPREDGVNVIVLESRPPDLPSGQASESGGGCVRGMRPQPAVRERNTGI